MEYQKVMIIIEKEFHKNKTRKYLMPCLKGYGEHYANFISSVFKLAVGIHDTIIEDTPIKGNGCIFILTDMHPGSTAYLNFLGYIKEHMSYVADYCFEPDIDGSTKRMFILRIPMQYENAYEMFIKGKYGDMFTEKEIEHLFNSERSKVEISILKRDPLAITNLQDSIKREHGQFIKDSDFIGDIIEYETPLNKFEEIFNY